MPKEDRDRNVILIVTPNRDRDCYLPGTCFNGDRDNPEIRDHPEIPNIIARHEADHGIGA